MPTLHAPSRRSTPTRPLASLPVAGFEPTGPDLSSDPLAPVVTPWPGYEGGAGPAEDALRGLTERAGVQAGILRRALDEAARMDQALARRATELVKRAQQAVTVASEVDRRLDAAGRAAQLIDQVGTAARSLEDLLGRVEAAHERLSQAVSAEVAAQQERLARQLEEQQARFSAMLQAQADAAAESLREQAEAFAARLTEVTEQSQRGLESAKLAAAEAEAESSRIIQTMEGNLKAGADRLAASLDRQAAQAQARIAVVLDDANQMIGEAEGRVMRIGERAAAEFDRLCERVTPLLGMDPRSEEGDLGAKVREGSLLHVVERAEAAAKAGDDVVVRLTIAGERAAEIEAKMTASLEKAGASMSGREVLEQARAAEEQLIALRDDLESTAASVRYNVSQAQQAEAGLSRTIDRAREKAQGLERAMDQVTDQAGCMVQVARDVAGLVLRAEQARQALAEVVEGAARPSADEDDGAAQGRRAPFAPPHAREGGESAAAA